MFRDIWTKLGEAIVLHLHPHYTKAVSLERYEDIAEHQAMTLSLEKAKDEALKDCRELLGEDAVDSASISNIQFEIECSRTTFSDDNKRFVCTAILKDWDSIVCDEKKVKIEETIIENKRPNR